MEVWGFGINYGVAEWMKKKHLNDLGILSEWMKRDCLRWCMWMRYGIHISVEKRMKQHARVWTEKGVVWHEWNLWTGYQRDISAVTIPSTRGLSGSEAGIKSKMMVVMKTILRIGGGVGPWHWSRKLWRFLYKQKLVSLYYWWLCSTYVFLHADVSSILCADVSSKLW